MKERKRRLLAGLGGTIVEIGPGTGPNLRHLGPTVRWIGVEPNRWMDRYLLDEARERGLRVHLIRGRAQALSLADGSVDAVLSTLVLCSVEPLSAALAEIHRVLRPGGCFVFVEHVGALRGSWLRLLQRGIRPAWRRVADGCRPDRETGERIREAGFGRVDMEHFRLPLPVVGPHVAGTAWK